MPDSDELAVIDANETAIEATGANLHSYTAPGEGHGLFEFADFYQLEVHGTRLVDWLDDLINGKTPDDIQLLLTELPSGLSACSWATIRLTAQVGQDRQHTSMIVRRGEQFQLREDVRDVRFDGLRREEEPIAVWPGSSVPPPSGQALLVRVP